ncbi:MAG: thioredoxin domain-containing protein [Chitinophagaceae bacterium]
MKKSGFTIIILLSLSNGNAQIEKKIDADKFEKSIAGNNTQLLDVRTMGEFRGGHLKDALLADWNDINQFIERTKHLDKAKPLYVYCLSGGRSSAAADWLRKQGFTSVYELEGGINAWKRQNKPVEGIVSKKQMTVNEYQALVNTSATILVDFGAEWCPPCKKMEPVLHTLQEKYGSHYKLVKVDGGNDTDVMNANHVDALPVFIIYKNGKEVWRKQGITTLEELRKNL